MKNQQRLDELKTNQALFGLNDQEVAELSRLGADFSDYGSNEFEMVAARVDQISSASVSEAMPNHLRAALKREAKDFFDSSNTAGDAKSVPASGDGKSICRITGRLGLGVWLPWLISAAAVLWMMSQFFIPANRPAPLTAQRLALLDADDAIRVEWSAGPTPIDGATGDIVWSPSRQQGFMRFKNLRVNDPRKEQYQLWIFSKNQSEKTPIDGGVFDISSEAETVVPVVPKLEAEGAYLFAVTMEKPGGVVVSSRKRLPLLAKVTP